MLDSNGTDAKLIRFLLQDAKIWEVLSRLLKDQVMTLRSLEESYENKNWTILHEEDKDKVEEKIKAFRDDTDRLSDEVQESLRNLTATSQTLIQLVKTLVRV